MPSIAEMIWNVVEVLAALAALGVGLAFWCGVIWAARSWFRNFRQYSRHPIAKRLRRAAFMARQRARSAS
jgi:hypothetical protein